MKKFKDIFNEVIPYIIILIVVILIRTFIVTPVIVNGKSMMPTLKGNEMMLLFKNKNIKRYDIVVIDIEREEIIKRVIALPGESISCEDGYIYINGKKLEEKYSQGKTNDFKKIVLKEDEYFCLGDNRSNSLDSEELGPFKIKQIKGKASVVIFPFSKIRKV